MFFESNMKNSDVEKEVIIASFEDFILTSKRLLHKDCEREINNKFIAGVNASYKDHFIKKWLIIPLLICLVAFYLDYAQYIIRDTRYVIVDGSYFEKKYIIGFCILSMIFWLIGLFAGSLHQRHYYITVICIAPFKNLDISAEGNNVQNLFSFEKRLREVIHPSVILMPFITP